MSAKHPNRRDFLKTTATAAAAGTVPFWFPINQSLANSFKAPSERPVIGCIGTGDRWNGVGPNALAFGDCVAVCDVDSDHATKGHQKVKEIQGKKGVNREIGVYENYHELLERKDIEAVTIVTPDHWHTKIAIDAMRAGKDVYCEKPLTLTIDEGKQIIKVLEETGRVFQVGTQQRSEMGLLFLKAVAMIRDGRIGDVQKVTCNIGDAPTSGPLEKTAPPPNLNWDMWLGQAPKVDYIPRRCHYEFRWWYEYSGGKMTDWGAHHVDIAQWAIGMDNAGPVSVEGLAAKHPVPLKDGYPTLDNQYNVATTFQIQCMFPNGVEVQIVDNSPDGNGVLFEGTKGRFHVSRSRMKGKPVDDLEKNPIPEELITKLYKGKKPGNHMGNFFECIKTREQPISDVHTHHRAMTTCHLANIAIRLGRKINWDYQTQQIVGDADAAKWTSREQRKGFETNA
ncbi:MAG: Gfo/Idh/MocA family protein [Planctomycetaceae bacterium]